MQMVEENISENLANLLRGQVSHCTIEVVDSALTFKSSGQVVFTYHPVSGASLEKSLNDCRAFLKGKELLKLT